MCPVDFDFSVFAPYLDDSKKMSESEREEIYHRIERVMESNICRYHFAYREASDIDKLWIREANRQCMQEVILGLLQYTSDTDTIRISIDGCDNYEFGIDGFEYIFAKKRRKWVQKDMAISVISKNEISFPGKQSKISPTVEMTETSTNPILINHNSITYLINGDALSPVISAASVVAKVTRDRMMCDFHEDFPEFCFSEHKGYGTRRHRESLLNYGITPIHRKSYEPMKSLILNSSSV